MQIAMEPVAWVRGGRTHATDDSWWSERCSIDLADRFDGDAVAGLAEFSHLEVVYCFHLVDPASVTTGARRPRSRPDWPEVGIFAQRGRVRPNRIGVSLCAIESVEARSIHVRGLDAVDGTPVMDLKPYLSGFAPRGPLREPTWAHEIMADYW